MANDLRNSLLKQQLGDSATKKLVTREEGVGEQQETSSVWVNLEHTEFSQDNKNAMGLLLLLAER